MTATPKLVMMPAGVGMPAQYPPSGSITTKELDLGATPPTRPVLLYPTLDNASPAAGSVTVTRYRTRSLPTDPWGAWTNTAPSAGGGALTLGAPQRYLQAELLLSTTDTTQTPTLVAFGVYD